MPRGRTLVLFNHDFDRIAHERLAADWPQVNAGFDLFQFPSQMRLAWFDAERFAALQALRARAQGLTAVVSHHEQFGALVAALTAERLGWPGTPVHAVLACQHKLHARQVLARVCPEASTPFAVCHPNDLAGLGSDEGPSPSDNTWPPLPYPFFVKPIKAAFSILAREVHSAPDLARHLRFGLWESALLGLLVRPFDRVMRQRFPQAESAMGVLLEKPVHAAQYNLDGYVLDGEVNPLGVVDSVMYPGTKAFMRFDYPSRLPPPIAARALDVARRFLQAVGFTHGLFNMEFFYDPASDRLAVIEFNPRLASQFSDLYERVDGVNLHEVALALAHGMDPALLPRRAPTARVASSFVYRSFDQRRGFHRPSPVQRGVLQAAYPDALLLEYPKTEADIQRDLKWLGSCRHGILHLGGQDEADLLRRCEVASRLLGWNPPYSDFFPTRAESAEANWAPAAEAHHGALTSVPSVPSFPSFPSAR